MDERRNITAAEDEALILDSVHRVRDRFGPDGLRALIAEVLPEFQEPEAMDG